jgi:hypothetical protein
LPKKTWLTGRFSSVLKSPAYQPTPVMKPETEIEQGLPLDAGGVVAARQLLNPRRRRREESQTGPRKIQRLLTSSPTGTISATLSGSPALRGRIVAARQLLPF